MGGLILCRVRLSEISGRGRVNRNRVGAILCTLNGTQRERRVEELGRRLHIHGMGGAVRVGDVREISIEERKNVTYLSLSVSMYEGGCRRQLSCSQHITPTIATRQSLLPRTSTDLLKEDRKDWSSPLWLFRA